MRVLSILMLLVAFLGCNRGGGNGKKPPPPDGSVVQQLLVIHNEERSKRGVPKLKLDDRLTAAAQLHADWMRSNGRLSHRGENGSSVSGRIVAQGYRWSAAGENIAAGYSSAQSVTSGWMGSSGHRRNILNDSYVHCGFGKSGNYWCAVFARPSGGRKLAVQEPGPLRQTK